MAHTWRIPVALAALVVTTASSVQAGQAVTGIEVGAVLPVSTFRQTADPGGMLAPFAGYQFGDSIAFTAILQPMYSIFGTADIPNRQNDFTTIFAMTAGGRVSFNDERMEIFFSAQGGYYTDVLGPIDDDGGGFNIAGGFNYDLWRGLALGAYLRRDQTSMRAARNSSDDLTFFTTGISLRLRFLPNESAKHGL